MGALEFAFKSNWHREVPFVRPTVLRVTGGRVPGRQARPGRAGCGPRPKAAIRSCSSPCEPRAGCNRRVPSVRPSERACSNGEPRIRQAEQGETHRVGRAPRHPRCPSGLILVCRPLVEGIVRVESQGGDGQSVCVGTSDANGAEGRKETRPQGRAAARSIGVRRS